jgi:hypothetical protein
MTGGASVQGIDLGTDPSGNKRLPDVGLWLKEKTKSWYACVHVCNEKTKSWYACVHVCNARHLCPGGACVLLYMSKGSMSVAMWTVYVCREPCCALRAVLCWLRLGGGAVCFACCLRARGAVCFACSLAVACGAVLLAVRSTAA